MKGGLVCLLVLLAVLGGLELCAQEWSWAATAGGVNSDRGSRIARDSAGNLYVTGYFNGGATFGASTIYGAGQDTFVAKLDPSGYWLWAVPCGGINSDDKGTDIAVDAQGNCYISGYYRGIGTFGPYTLTPVGATDVFVAKLDSGGNWLWAASGGGTDWDYGNGIAVDNLGNCYVTGSFGDTASFGQYSVTLNPADWVCDIFIAKLDPAGNWLWARRAGGSDPDYGMDVAVDGAGNCYVTGSFYDDVADFGPDEFTQNECDCAFISKLDIAGNWLWTERAGGSWPCAAGGNGIALDEDGNCFVTGSFFETIGFGATPLTSNGEEYSDIFIAKLDPAGNWQWAKRAGSTNYDEGKGICADSAGNCYATGYFNDTADFGPTNLSSAGFGDVFACGLDGLGNWLWAERAGGSSYDNGYGITTDNSGNLFLTGNYNATAGFGDYSLISAGLSDLFAAKLSFQSSPIPRAPENLQIYRNNLNMDLSWDPVTEDTGGQPLTPDGYNIYISGNNADWAWLDFTPGTAYVHINTALVNVRVFYKVTAVKN
ncbi:MAG: SBBP repeat-containing protein [Candidatus Cloacimonetes bacterium]|nr:SBBP repeat-containing protein [Candidatus Cloacimonadota bacterium]